jgi:hypothetical protein
MDRMSQSETTGPSAHLANRRFALQRVSALTGVDGIVYISKASITKKSIELLAMRTCDNVSVLRTAKTRTDDGKECIVHSTKCVLIRDPMFQQLCLHDSATRLRALSSALVNLQTHSLLDHHNQLVSLS